MKSHFEPVTVTTDKKGTPARVVWRGRLFLVSRVVDRWRIGGQWWLGPMQAPRTYYRLEARPVLERGQLNDPRILEVFRQGKKWKLSDLCD